MTSFSAVIHEEERMFVAKCPEVGTVSQGKTIEQALKNLKEATELYLEEFPFKENGKPIMTVFEFSKVMVEEGSIRYLPRYQRKSKNWQRSLVWMT